MECLWNREYLEQLVSSEKGTIEKQIQVLEMINDYDLELDSIFHMNEQDDDANVEFVVRPEITVSAVLIVRNEERCILRCLQSVLPEFDEIIIVDTGSEDATVELIQSLENEKIKLYCRTWTNSFADARNYALEHVTKEWAFFIDADEYLDLHELSVKDYLSTFHNFPVIQHTIFSPKIVDVNGHTVIGVERIFRTGFGIRYYGAVHEELRKYEGERFSKPFQVCLDLPIKHDGYTDNVMARKDKVHRNLRLIEQMMKAEPDNPRWVYFYLRDGQDVISLETYKKYMDQYLLLDSGKPMEIDNLKEHKFTYALLSLYAVKEFQCGEMEEMRKLTALMDNMNPENSDGVYLNAYSELLMMQTRKSELLKEILAYRKENLDSQYGALHSEGKHLDVLIGYLLFVTGHIQKATAYFDWVKDIAENDSLVQFSRNMIYQIKELGEVK